MPTDPDQTRREECRFAVRSHLAARPGIAQKAETIRAGINLEHDFTLREVGDALEFLRSLNPPQVLAETAPLGATQYYEITAAGTLAHERRQ